VFSEEASLLVALASGLASFGFMLMLFGSLYDPSWEDGHVIGSLFVSIGVGTIAGVLTFINIVKR